MISPGKSSREVSLTAMQEFSEAQKAQYFECELDDVGVNEIFMSIVDKIMNNTLTGGTRDSTDAGKDTSGTS